ncbi:HlyD family efflux transporter periplasmic adaptor subunit [Halioglobus maricola]|uniref:HlyD family efflux transporter periplasmic adaptor subunit n=1 Tax=Halioglobus maricola TaxID=2601894 RepID=A0A5P9NI68_9GAMM|nr:HlyD family efflux transporter periplasmic adaptor subunit [Halioglobus maricola]QFU74884.1 HlyD family efflux transporter periplasmic adaptor subunit [Halioglobus maricola]
MQLFRQQALNAQRYRLYGEVMLKPRISHRVCAIFLLLWFATSLLWLAKGSYAKRESVQGWLQPVDGSIEVTAPADASIAQVLVVEGETVIEGQTLLVLQRSQVLASGVKLEDKLLEQYRLQHDALINRRNSVAQRNQQLEQQTEQTLLQAKQELRFLDDQIKAARSESSLLTTQKEEALKLASKGHLPRYSADETTLRYLASTRAHAALRQREQALTSRINRLQSELSLLPVRADEETASIAVELSELFQNIYRIKGNGQFTIKAARSGTVHNLQARQGLKVSQVNGPLMDIASAGALEARLLVPVRSVGFIQPGQRVSIQYHAFPYQQFGSYTGEIVQLTGQAILPRKVDNNPLPIAEPVYQVTASLGDQRLRAAGDEQNLLPGMTFDAIIILGERSLLQWLLSPIYSMRGRLL